MLKKVTDITNSECKGLNTLPNIFVHDPKNTPDCMNVKINNDGSVEKRLGTNTQNAASIGASSAVGFQVDSNNTLETG